MTYSSIAVVGNKHRTVHGGAGIELASYNFQSSHTFSASRRDLHQKIFRAARAKENVSKIGKTENKHRRK